MQEGEWRFVFQGNKFGAEAALKDSWDILALNDQDPRGRGRAKTLNTLGFILDSIQAIARGGQRR